MATMRETMRTHLKEMHSNHASFHIKASKAHAALAKTFGGMKDMEGADDLAAGHKELAAAHADAAENAISCCKTLDDAFKAMIGGDDDLSKIVPDGVRAVYPNNNMLVTRTGQPSAAQNANVPNEFAKLVAVEDDL